MDAVTAVNLLILALLIVATAFFVGSEFAVVKIRMSRLDQLIAEGHPKAPIAKKVATDLDYYLSACQLGITVTALGLGAIGKPAVESLLMPVFNWLDLSASAASAASYAIAFMLVTFLHVVVGEMAPKTLAIQFSEKMTLLLAGPLYWFGKLMYPLIWALNGTSRLLLRSVGIRPAGHEQAYTEEELRLVLAQSSEGGEIRAEQLDYLDNVFSFDERTAKDVMVPRTSIVAIDSSMEAEAIIRLLDESNYTRYPVVEGGNRDRILGVVNVKRMLPHIVAGRPLELQAFLRDVPSVLEVTPLQEAMKRMQQERIHMAVVIDEYGGTSGILTMEDILEELVGEIRDEFDADEIADIRSLGDAEYEVSGLVLLDELEQEFGLRFEEQEDVDTIGGWIRLHAGEAPAVGDRIEKAGAVWTVAETDPFRITRVKLQLPARTEAE
ncbi:hemolysin family protein [Paenibacillus pasadenensis]|uniref:hemolysin family protein n=1 Tax=Paenibacillus pasadenensis TaxID=217090 RepID=UPI00040AEC79|nr:hemolysin family protein [Paenibacillus pasadenensis]